MNEGPGPSDHRDEERPEHDLRPEDGLHRAEGAEEGPHEVRVDRRVEDQVAAKRREAHRRPPDLSLGYHVLALDNDDGEWYHARITYKSGDAYMISWEDGVDPDEYRVGYELREP